MSRVELTDHIADMFKASRIQSGKSQEYVAKALGVSKKTVQNYESGLASPNIRTALEWFETLGVPMYPYILTLLHPSEMEVSADSSTEDLRRALITFISELDDHHVRELLYLFFGSHGSSPDAILEATTAYLHTPMLMRIAVVEHIATNYEVCLATGNAIDTDHIKPKPEDLRAFINAARSAAVHGHNSYAIPGGKEA